MISKKDIEEIYKEKQYYIFIKQLRIIDFPTSKYYQTYNSILQFFHPIRSFEIINIDYINEGHCITGNCSVQIPGFKQSSNIKNGYGLFIDEEEICMIIYNLNNECYMDMIANPKAKAYII